MKRIKLGDLVEFSTPAGLVYSRYINRHARYGALLQVFSKVHDERPSKVADIAGGDVQFVCFFPLRAAIGQGVCEVVGNVAVEQCLTRLPTFRAGVVDPKTGKVGVWWLWDGEKEWQAGTLTPQQRYLPIRGIWNDTMLIERLLAGWRPENDPTT